MSYEKFATNYRRYTHAPRSLDEAFKTADYATPIWRCETKAQRERNVVIDYLLVALFIAIGAFVINGFLTWLEGLK